MSTTETWTIGKLLTWTTDYLKRAGSTSPRLDAEVLLAHARGCQRIELYTAFAEEPSEETRTAFRELVKRRAEGEPVAYLVGYKEFYSMTFEVTSDVLIPRPETEHLVVESLDRAKSLLESKERLQIVDVGTGSGAIAVALAKHLLEIRRVSEGSGDSQDSSQAHASGFHRIFAVDVCPKALDLAKKNAHRHGIDDDQISFVEGDLLSWCEPSQQFDLVVSNPPYVSPSEFEQLPKTVRDFEPRHALVSEPEAGSVIAQLIGQAENHLQPGGYLIFEFSPMLESELSNLIANPQVWSSPKIIKDVAGLARVVTLQKKV